MLFSKCDETNSSELLLLLPTNKTRARSRRATSRDHAILQSDDSRKRAFWRRIAHVAKSSWANGSGRRVGRERRGGGGRERERAAAPASAFSSFSLRFPHSEGRERDLLAHDRHAPCSLSSLSPRCLLSFSFSSSLPACGRFSDSETWRSRVLILVSFFFWPNPHLFIAPVLEKKKQSCGYDHHIIRRTIIPR